MSRQTPEYQSSPLSSIAKTVKVDDLFSNLKCQKIAVLVYNELLTIRADLLSKQI